jgi:Uma2 family endonuclease
MKMLKAKEQYENRMPARGFQSPVALKARRKIIYPDSDGKPMADNTEQFDWIVKIKENLERIFYDNSDVFIAGDLLWYPEEGNNKIRIAPDAMVVSGRPKGRRGSYRLWEESYVPPQVVFEILSPGNRRAELDGKFQFYQKYGVEEYYIYDPDRIRLNGWIRTGNILIPIANMNGWTSPLLKIRFELALDDLTIYCPDGTRFLSTVELDQIAKANYQRAETESRKAEAEHQRAEAEHQRADAECREKERLAAKLRELGIEI